MEYTFVDLDRSELPRFGPVQLQELEHVVELVVQPFMPVGNELHLLIRRFISAKGVSFRMSFDSFWIRDQKELAFTLLHTIAKLSGVDGYNYPHGSYTLYITSKQLTAHDIIQARSEIARICAARNLNSAQLLQPYDKALSDHTTQPQ